MHWKTRAKLLKAMAVLPGGRSAYLWLQDRIGNYVQPKHIAAKFDAQRKLARAVIAAGGRIEAARIMEVGTGWVPLAPLGFWLCGAADTFTYDLHRNLRPRLLHIALEWMVSAEEELVAVYEEFAPADQIRGRLAVIGENLQQPEEILRRAGIHYQAPSDAGNTQLDESSIDLHISLYVLEHVPADQIARILTEAARVLKRDGRSAHLIDPTDHFSHTDPSITTVNFLQYEDEQWDKLAGNSLAYHNRLRQVEYEALFRAAGLDVPVSDFNVDQRALAALRNGLPLAERFQRLDAEELCRRGMLVVAQNAAVKLE